MANRLYGHWDDSVVDLCTRMAMSEGYGVRRVQQFLRQEIMTKIASFVLYEKISCGDNISIQSKENRIVVVVQKMDAGGKIV